MKRIAVAAVALTGAHLIAVPSAAQSPSNEQAGVPRAVEIARATEIPKCGVFVDAAAAPGGDGSLRKPHKTIGAAVSAAEPGAVICVAEGVYAEQIKPGDKHFTLAGGFQRGKEFRVRDSAAHVSKAQGKGGSFLRIEDPAPSGNKLTAIDGFEITGYSQAIFRDYWESQRFDITNNHIHGNKCASNELAGGGFSLENVSARIEGNVFRGNSCGRGGAGAVHDGKGENTVTIARNLIDDNHGTEPDSSHGGALYLFGKTLRVTGNLFTRNSVTNWGGALYVGAYTAGGEYTSANLNWNVYIDNRAGVAGGGFFCDDGASCRSYHEIYYRNCGGNIFLDSGSGKTEKDATTARFDHLTNVGALAVGCKGPGEGVRIDRGDGAPDRYSFVNAIFWGNAPERDLVASCDANCGNVRIDVNHSMMQTKYGSNGLKVNFGEGIVQPTDPLFADPEKGDFHLKSAAGRWTAKGRVNDPASSPALGKGLPAERGGDNPERAGPNNELGAFGNSIEASYIR